MSVPRAILGGMDENNDVPTVFFDSYRRALLDRDAAAIADHYAVPAQIEFPGQRIAVTDARQTEEFFAGAFSQYADVTEAEVAVEVVAEAGHSIWADVAWRYHGGAQDERNMYQLVRVGDDWKIGVLTPLKLDEQGEKSGTGDHPQLLHTVIDSAEPRELAEFYRQLFGYVYRLGDEPPEGTDPDDDVWLVLTDQAGRRMITFQKTERLERSTWPDPTVPMQLHLDFTVTDRKALEKQRERAERLGARLILDRVDDEEEPLYVFADLAGHPFCIFVA